MNREKFVQWCFDMHLQNTNGRETDEEMFKLGIEAAVEEMHLLNEMELLYDKHIKSVQKDVEHKYEAMILDWYNVSGRNARFAKHFGIESLRHGCIKKD